MTAILRTEKDLIALANLGAALEVDANSYSAVAIRNIAVNIKPKAYLRVLNSDRLTQQECGNILSAPQLVIFC